MSFTVLKNIYKPHGCHLLKKWCGASFQNRFCLSPSTIFLHFDRNGAGFRWYFLYCAKPLENKPAFFWFPARVLKSISRFRLRKCTDAVVRIEPLRFVRLRRSCVLWKYSKIKKTIKITKYLIISNKSQYWFLYSCNLIQLYSQYFFLYC